MDRRRRPGPRLSRRPGLTAARFVEARGERWYRTGDLARYDAVGALHFVGRADHRVKVGGVRVELGEVEAALASHPRVRTAVVVLLEDPAPRLAAAVLAEDDVDVAELRSHAAERLPASMTPAAIRTLRDLPLTPNAKADRAAVARLLAEAEDRPEDDSAAPRGDREQELAGLWKELLGASGVSRGDSFFARGGDSLLATRLVADLRARGWDGVGVGTVFRHPVLADLAARLIGAGPAAAGREAAPGIVHDAAGRHEPFPLTGVQRAYLTGRDPAFVLGGAGTSHYTEFDAEDLDVARLARALDRLVERHDMLRAVLDADGAQRVLPEVPPVSVPVRDADPADPEGSLAAFSEEMSHRVLDPARWPLFEVRALRHPHAGRERTRLGVVLDYLVLDALSIMTFYRELQELYLDPDAVLPPLGITFRDCVLASAPDPARERRALEHWRRRVEELPPAPALPLAVDPSAIGVPRFACRSDHLGPAEWTALAGVAREAGLTASSLLLACYGEVLAAWSGRTGVAITLTLFNRPGGHPDLERVLGDFTSLSLAGYDRAPGTSPLEAARRLHGRLGEDLDHREVSAERVLRDLSRREGAAEAGVPVVFTGSLGLGDGRGLDPLRGFATRVGGLSQSPQVHLDNQVLESHGGLDVSWDAVEELFLPGVLDEMFAAYLGLLRRLAREGLGAWDRAAADLLPAGQRRRREEIDAAAGSGPAPGGLLHDAFLDRALREPDAPALIGDGGALTRGRSGTGRCGSPRG
ncbi:condensation domain-containing protein [Rothia sp. AR01]|uniref:Condensation domain-containing protein n=1 Tax=Rothia santali TaxID=2949643 RepID=A0A9X2H8H7_9MICC|nr:condensation domain-containing protein [Rothia santali]MCP3424656.1 condensation domain-containing protein [Rothia santali]